MSDWFNEFLQHDQRLVSLVLMIENDHALYDRFKENAMLDTVQQLAPKLQHDIEQFLRCKHLCARLRARSVLQIVQNAARDEEYDLTFEQLTRVVSWLLYSIADYDCPNRPIQPDVPPPTSQEDRTMSNDNIYIPSVKDTTFVDGVEAASFSIDALIGKIEAAQAAKKRLEAIENKGRTIAKRIEALDDAIATLNALIDAR